MITESVKKSNLSIAGSSNAYLASVLITMHDDMAQVQVYVSQRDCL